MGYPVAQIGGASADILGQNGEPVSAIGNGARDPQKDHDRHGNDGATACHHIDSTSGQPCQNEGRYFPQFQIHGSGPGAAHGHEFLGGSGVNPDGAVKVGFGGPHFHRDGKTLTDFTSVGTYHVGS